MRIDDVDEERSFRGLTRRELARDQVAPGTGPPGKRRDDVPRPTVRRRIADGLGVDVVTIWPGCGLDGEARRDSVVVAP